MPPSACLSRAAWVLTALFFFCLAFMCDFPGCEKEFSRQDNLHQHMRVHKGYVSKGPGFQ